jgi:hypothetical protein
MNGKRIFRNALLFLVATPGLLYAQPSSTTTNIQWPQQPDVASLLRFTEVPVSRFNGSADINVPLYTIKSGDINFPITINYHTSGIKVSEDASLVGLGWSLSTVAAISETDPPAAANYGFNQPITPDGFDVAPSQEPVGVFNIVESGEAFFNSSGQCNTYPAFQPPSIRPPNYEPDLYVMSANGISGKFFIPNGGAINGWVTADASNIKLTGNMIVGGGGYGSGLTATMPDGSQYIFNDIALTTTPSTPQLYQIPMNTISHTIYLSQIVSPAGKTIRFKYLHTQSGPYTISQQGLSELWANDNAPLGVGFQSGAALLPSSTIENKYLDTIYFDNGFAKYFYSTRLDMGGYKLDSIDIFRQGQSLAVRTIAFQYGYYAYNKGNYGDYITDAVYGPSLINGPVESYRGQRLKLLSVRIDQDPPYTFEYENSALPYKTSFAQDLWGYFNGNPIKTLLPNYNLLGYLDAQIPIQLFGIGTNLQFADRRAVYNFTKTGILEQINYPTGGYSTFQYEPNTFFIPGNGNLISDTVVAATDIGVGEQSVVFTVPDVGLKGTGTQGVPLGNPANPVSISVFMICGGNGSCSSTGYSGNCEGYVQTDSTHGLYCYIQAWDPAFNEWDPPQQQNVFDFRNGNLNRTGTEPCNVNNFSEELPPGLYRMVANFPDNLTTGAYDGPSAAISMDYKVSHPNIFPNTGGGLRIKAITDYAAGGQVALKRQFKYSSGKMMTKPIFYRTMNGLRPGAPSEGCTPSGPNVWNYPMSSLNGCIPTGEASGTIGPAPVNTLRTFLLLFNDPLIPYSYSANGSPVGYDTVWESHVDGQGSDQGRTIFVYNASPDSYTWYGTNLPGTPGTPDLTNGALLQQIDQKRIGQSYTTVHSTSYNYSVGSPAAYFGYRVEYMPNYRTDGTQEFENQGLICTDPFSQFLHFYPIKTGHLNLIARADIDSANGIGMATYTNYTYNALNQVSSESITKTNGKTLTHHTLYPGDYTNPGDFTSTMRTLNMLNYPIERYTTVNNLATQGSYMQYFAHDNMVTPSAQYSLDIAQPTAISVSAPGNTKDGHYSSRMNYTYDANGNQIQFQQTSGERTNIIWDYNHSLPVAEILNAAPNDYAYTSFEADGKGNWTYSGAPVADQTTPAGNSSYLLSNGAISMSTLSPAETYVVSYWTTNASPYTLPGALAGYPMLVRSYNGWKFYMHKLTGQSSLLISGSGSIDDLRLYPDNAQMRTSIYDPLFGVTSLTDFNGKMAYYKYDADMRLKNILDLNGNVVKDFQYGYIGFDQNNNHTIYYSAAINTSVAAGKCSPGYRGAAVAYMLPYGAYTSFISQADADAQAQNDVATQGQDLADQAGACMPAPCVAPTISSVTVSGNVYTITYSGLVGQVAFLDITDGTPGNNIIPITLNPALSSNTYVGTVPATGKIYYFQVMVAGQTCPSILSNQVSAQF